MKINKKHLRTKALKFKTEKKIPYEKIGEVCGSTAKDTTTRAKHGKKVLSDENYDLSLEQVESLAEFIGEPVEQLLFDAPLIEANGEHAQSSVSFGQKGDTFKNGVKERSVYEMLDSMTIEEIKALSSYMEFLIAKKGKK